MVPNQCFKHELFEVPYVVFHDQKGVLNFLKNKKNVLFGPKYLFTHIFFSKSYLWNHCQWTHLHPQIVRLLNVSPAFHHDDFGHENWNGMSLMNQLKKNSKHYEILGPTHFQNAMLLFTKGDHCPKGFYFKTTFRTIMIFFLSFDTIPISTPSK